MDGDDAWPWLPLLSDDAVADPAGFVAGLDARALLDRAIGFTHGRGQPSAGLTGHEWARWLEVHGPGTW